MQQPRWNVPQYLPKGPAQGYRHSGRPVLSEPLCMRGTDRPSTSLPDTSRFVLAVFDVVSQVLQPLRGDECFRSRRPTNRRAWAEDTFVASSDKIRPSDRHVHVLR